MIKAHIFLDGELVAKRQLDHPYRKGETIRFSDDKYGTVTEVVWCLDEIDPVMQRVNFRVESEDADA